MRSPRLTAVASATLIALVTFCPGVKPLCAQSLASIPVAPAAVSAPGPLEQSLNHPQLLMPTPDPRMIVRTDMKPLKVKQEKVIPLKPPEKYDPTFVDITKASSFSDKAFNTTASVTDSEHNTAVNLPVYKPKPFDLPKPSTDATTHLPQLSQTSYKTGQAFQTSSYSGAYTSYAGTKSNSLPKTFAVKTLPSDLPTYAVPAKPNDYSNKTYDGPEVQKAKTDMKQVSSLNSLAGKFPDHPLSIDEVKDLLNHGKAPPGYDDSLPSQDSASPPPAPAAPDSTPDFAPRPNEQGFQAVDPAARNEPLPQR